MMGSVVTANIGDCTVATQTLRVLVVDDDHDTVDSSCLLLNAWGYDSISAYSGEAALALAAERHPHVVLFDLAMPGLDGYGLAHQVCAVPGMRDALLVSLSGYPLNLKRAEGAGWIHFLKPAPLAELERILAEKAATLAEPSA